jgi:hypothetical protein
MLAAAIDGNSKGPEFQPTVEKEGGFLSHAPCDLKPSAAADALPDMSRELESPPTDQEHSCTDDQQCEEGLSCWYKIPRGPSAGIRGSIEKPGQCWDNEIIKGTF